MAFCHLTTLGVAVWQPMSAFGSSRGVVLYFSLLSWRSKLLSLGKFYLGKWSLLERMPKLLVISLAA